MRGLTMMCGRNVSFTYPGGNDYALRDVSFKINPGQLCVRSPRLWLITHPFHSIQLNKQAIANKLPSPQCNTGHRR